MYYHTFLGIRSLKMGLTELKSQYPQDFTPSGGSRIHFLANFPALRSSLFSLTLGSSCHLQSWQSHLWSLLLWSHLLSWLSCFPLSPTTCCMLSRFSRVWLFATPWTVALPVLHGIPQARILEWVAISYFRGSSRPRDWTCISSVSCVGKQVLYHYSHLGSPSYSLNLTWKMPILVSPEDNTISVNVNMYILHTCN